MLEREWSKKITGAAVKLALELNPRRKTNHYKSLLYHLKISLKLTSEDEECGGKQRDLP